MTIYIARILLTVAATSPQTVLPLPGKGVRRYFAVDAVGSIAWRAEEPESSREREREIGREREKEEVRERERDERRRGHRGANRGWLKRERDSKQRVTPLVPETLPPISNSLSPSIFLSLLPPPALPPLSLHLPPFFLDSSLLLSLAILIPFSLSQFHSLLTLS